VRPQPIAQDHGRGPIRAIFVVGEFAAERRGHTEHAKISGRHALLHHVFGLPAGHEIDAHPKTGERRDVEFGCRFAQCDPRHTRLRHIVLATRPLVVADDDGEAVGTRVRQRAQQHAIDHAVNGCVGADAESERQRSGDRENGTLEEDAQGVAKVAHVGIRRATVPRR
jgi:hypothetical protein